jgi:hypothetical protein
MYHPIHNLPVFEALGVPALVAGPLSRLPIDLGAWLLARLCCPPVGRRQESGT